MDEREVILIVEDDSDLRDLYTKFLRSVSYDVLAAGDGNEALRILEALATSHPRTTLRGIVSDWVMPNADGAFLLSRLRSSPFGNTPVVIMSGALTRDQLLEITKAGADAVILKPFEPPALLGKLLEAAQRREEREISGLFDQVSKGR